MEELEGPCVKVSHGVGGPCVEACHGVVGGGEGGRGRHPADRWGGFSGLGAPWGPGRGLI